MNMAVYITSRRWSEALDRPSLLPVGRGAEPTGWRLRASQLRLTAVVEERVVVPARQGSDLLQPSGQTSWEPLVPEASLGRRCAYPVFRDGSPVAEE